MVRDILRLFNFFGKEEVCYRYMFSKNILKKLDFKFEIVWVFFLFNDVLCLKNSIKYI